MQPLLPLDGLQIINDRARLLGLKDEFRHVRVTSRNAFSKASASTSILKLRERVRNGGAAGINVIRVLLFSRERPSATL
jgi:hypothetical protein